METRKPIIFLTFLLLLILTLGGCTSFKDRPLSAVDTASGLEFRSLTNPGLGEFLKANLHQDQFSWPLESWNLTQLTVAAFYYHPDLDVARAEVGLAEAGKITAGMRPNPTISFSPQFDSNALASASPWTLGWSLNVPIETAGKRGLRLDQAKHQIDAARFKLLGTAWQIRSRARSACLALDAAQQKREIMRNLVDVQDRQVSLLERRLAVGAISQPEVTQAHLARQQSQLLLAEAERENTEVRASLASALGVPVRSLDGIALSFDTFDRLPPIDSLSIAQLRRQALINRADILKALAEYDASQSALQLEIAKQYPDIQMNPGYQWDQGENKWSLGVSLKLPLLNQNEGPIAQAEAGRSLAAASFLALQTKVLGEVDQSAAGLRAAADKLATAEELLTARERQQRAALAQFHAGETDRLALAGAEAELASSRLARLEAWNRAQQALGGVEDALQRPLAGESGHPFPHDPPRPGFRQ